MVDISRIIRELFKNYNGRNKRNLNFNELLVNKKKKFLYFVGVGC